MESANNIKSKTFSKSKRGFDENEVLKFLNEISETVSALENEVSQKNDELQVAIEKIDEYQKIEQKMRDSLISLSEPANEAALKAKEQAKNIIEEAQSKSDDIIIKAEEEAKSLRDTLLFLREQQELFFTRIKIMIETQESILEQLSGGIEVKSVELAIKEGTEFVSNAELKIDKILEKLL